MSYYARHYKTAFLQKNLYGLCLKKCNKIVWIVKTIFQKVSSYIHLMTNVWESFRKTKKPPELIQLDCGELLQFFVLSASSSKTPQFRSPDNVSIILSEIDVSFMCIKLSNTLHSSPQLSEHNMTMIYP